MVIKNCYLKDLQLKTEFDYLEQTNYLFSSNYLHYFIIKNFNMPLLSALHLILLFFQLIF